MSADTQNLVSPFRRHEIRTDPSYPDRALFNLELNRSRSVVENTICQLKKWRVIQERFRYGIDKYEEIFMACVHLTQRNFITRKPPRPHPDEDDVEMGV